jgi:hypothetical protein
VAGNFRQGERGKKPIKAQSFLIHAYTFDYHKENDTMLPMASWKIVCNHRERVDAFHLLKLV